MRRAAPTSDRGVPAPAAGALALALLLGACARDGGLQEASLPLAGGDAVVQARDADPAKLQAAIAEATTASAAATAEWHAWRPSTLVDINNAFRRGQSVPSTPTIERLLARSRTFATASGGLLDPAIGGLVDLWGFHADRFPLTTPPPTKASIDAWLAARPRLEQVTLAGGKLTSSNPSVQLDFNSIVEGEGALALAATLRRHGVRDARLVLGGDQLALGDDGGRPWRVPLRDPYGGELGSVELADGEAFFTSGNYDKFRTSTSGGRWGHVLDPRTGMPARGAAATAVLSDDPVHADAASTALMVGGPAAFKRLVADLDIGCALMVTEENELLITRAMRARFTFARNPIPLGPDVDAGGDCRAPMLP